MEWVVCVSGSRFWTDQKHGECIESGLLSVQKRWGRGRKMVVVHGDCDGVDRIAAKRAKKIKGVRVIPVPAQWKKYGRGAGPIRNRKMIVDHRPEVMLIFHDDLKNSKGFPLEFFCCSLMTVCRQGTAHFVSEARQYQDCDARKCSCGGKSTFHKLGQDHFPRLIFYNARKFQRATIK